MRLVTCSIDPLRLYVPACATATPPRPSGVGQTAGGRPLPSPVQHGDLVLDVVLFSLQCFLRDALDGHQPLGPLLLG